MDKSHLHIATYNLLAGRHAERLLATITKVASRKPAIFVFQEVPKKNEKSSFLKEILHSLGPTFKHITFFAPDEKDLGLTICWDSETVTLKKRSIKKVFFKPYTYSTREKFVQRFIVGLDSHPLKRRALSAVFEIYGKTIRITNVHLNIEGSWEKRQENLRQLVKVLDNQNVEVDTNIILGDFNTLFFSRGNERQEQQILEQILNKKHRSGEPKFLDLTKAIDYTADAIAEYTYPTWINRPLYTIMHALRLHAYRKLDYIWVKSKSVQTAMRAEMLHEPGSDHFPIIAKLQLY